MNDSEQETSCSREFYAAFLHSRMIGYRLYKNPRIENIKRRVGEFVRPGQRVLEIGCGIGIISEFMARKANTITVFASDLSAENIDYAKRTVSCPNIAWKVIDVTKDFGEVVDWINGPVDLIVMADVIEHIPSRHHLELFADLGRILNPGGKILLTLPSPQYQRYLTTHHPDELQPVDEILELSDLITLASRAGCVIKHYSLEDTGGTRNQYIHCVLDSATGIDALVLPRGGLPARALIRITAFINRRILLPFRKRKYIGRVLAGAHTTPARLAGLRFDSGTFRLYPEPGSNMYWAITARRRTLEEIIQAYKADIADKNVFDFGGVAGSYAPLFEGLCKRFVRTAVSGSGSGKIAAEQDTANAASDVIINVIISNQIIQHLPDPRAHLNEIHQRLADGGLLILSTCRSWPLVLETGDNSEWTNNGLYEFLGNAGFTTLSILGVMSQDSSRVQKWQDSVESMIPAGLKPGFYFLVQKLVAFVDGRASPESRAFSARELILVARKHAL